MLNNNSTSITKETILNSLDIPAFYAEELPGVNWNGKDTTKARCPFHEDHNPSLSITKSTGAFKCFSCLTRGSVFDFVMKKYSLDFSGAMSMLAERAGITNSKAQERKVMALYDYKDAGGKLIFQAVRYEPKGFSQRRPDSNNQGKWIYNLHGVQLIPYNLPEVIKADTVFIVEGEKDAESLRAIGLVVSCNAQGAGKWKAEYSEYFEDKRVYILPDNDKAGRDHALQVAKSLKGIAGTIKVIELPGLPEKGDVSDWIAAQRAAGKTAEESNIELRAIVKAAPEWQELETTEPEQQCFPVIAFPLDILPEPFDRLTSEYARALQVRPEVMAMGFMTVISGAIGNSVVLKVKTSWETPPFLWFAVIGTTGTGKSHAVEKIMKPVKHLQAKESKQHNELMQDYKKELANYKAKSGEPYPQELPAKRHYWTSNFTIEALIPMYQADARGLIVYVDELAGLIKGLNQYKSSGNDKENLISLFNATELKSDRKTGSGETNNSGAAVIGGIQPAIINTVFKDTDFNNGLIYRFLPLIVDHTPQMFTLDTISEASEETWKQAVNWMYEIPLEIEAGTSKILPHTLTLEPEALEAWRLFHDRYSKFELFATPKFRGFLPKLRGYCLKFMVVLHVMEGYQQDALSLIVAKNTIISAIRLTDYFTGQALKLVSEQSEEKNPYHSIIFKALNSLHAEVSGGKLSLNRIRDKVNELLPDAMQIDPSSNKKISSWLKEMGLSVEPGAGGLKYLIWDSEKISNEFSSLSSLSSLIAIPESEESEQSEQFSGEIK